MPIAAEVVYQAVHVAEANRATRIDEIELEIGAMRRVVPEALKLAFTAMSEGTLAEGAALKMTEIAVRAKCNPCGESFEPDIDASFACPKCGKADVQIMAGDDIVLKTVVCEANEEVTG